MPRRAYVLPVAALIACGSDPDPGPDAGINPMPDTLETATGCAGVYNPEQVLDLHLTMAAADWTALKADTTNSVLFAAQFQCNGDAPLPYPIGIRRKRSGGVDKPGLKIDFNHVAGTGHFFSLKKLSLENGISEGSPTAEVTDLVAEYMAWRVMQRSGAISGRAAFARVFVNGALIGTYVDVEQVDKRFLQQRLGHNDGWLYKKSGSPDDGYKTNELMPNPYEGAMCFWAESGGCAAPGATELATYLPQHLNVEQLLRVGAVNALLANTDALLGKDNNYYWYDWPAPRMYFPWDLDTTMKSTTASVFGGGMTTMYTDVLFTHWEDDYDQLLTAMLAGPLALPEIEAELARVARVAGAALDADPFVAGDAASAIASARSWWQARHPAVSAELAAH